MNILKSDLTELKQRLAISEKALELACWEVMKHQSCTHKLVTDKCRSCESSASPEHRNKCWQNHFLTKTKELNDEG